MPEQTPTNPEQEPILSFEQFSARSGEVDKPRYSNFFLYFSGGVGGEAYRQAGHYKKFAAEHLDLAESLIGQIGQEGFVNDDLATVDSELYEAYKIMRGYKGVSDKDLFT